MKEKIKISLILLMVVIGSCSDDNNEPKLVSAWEFDRKYWEIDVDDPEAKKEIEETISSRKSIIYKLMLYDDGTSIYYRPQSNTPINGTYTNHNNIYEICFPSINCNNYFQSNEKLVYSYDETKYFLKFYPNAGIKKITIHLEYRLIR